MAEIDASDVFPTDRAVDAVGAGEMTQVTRGREYADEGDRFTIDGRTFEVVAVDHRTLGDLTDEDAQREGSADLDAYRERLERAHGDGFEWDDDSEVVTHRVAPVEG
jgi:kynureninase